MTIARLVVALAVIACSISVSLEAKAQAFNDVLVQPPTLEAPQHGSVIGSLANLAFGPSDLVRGVFQLKSSFDAPAERGGLLAEVFPTYSPEAGISEWGMGWTTRLEIRRYRVSGDINYVDDGYTSPWGRLYPGNDGYWYPANLEGALRLSYQNDIWLATAADGTSYRFSERTSTSDGTYVWSLNEVTSIFGDRTELVYERNTSGRPFLIQVLYGGRAHTRDYRLRLEYEALEFPFTSYASGHALTLDRRISRIIVESRPAGAPLGAYETRWRFELEYEGSPLGPAFYLVAVEKIYASEKREPSVRYRYDFGDQSIADGVFSRVHNLDAFLALAGTASLQPDRATKIDLERDGLLDLEHHYSFTLVHQTQDGWKHEELPPEPPGVDRRCRPTVSLNNRPRILARMTPESSEPQVVHTSYTVSAGSTTIVLCDRAGNRLFQEPVGGIFELGPTARLVDLNRDHRPDIIRIGNGSYQILENRSDSGGFGFVPHDVRQLTPGITPEATWIEDFNGDGITDIIVRYAAGLVIWYGRGNHRYVDQGEVLQFWTISGTLLTNVRDFGLSLVDANKDGLSDVLFTQTNSAHLFMNRGTHFREHPVPALSSPNWDLSNPVIADLTGSGNIEIVYTDNEKAYSLALNTAATGLLVSVNDGKGTVADFQYKRADPVPDLGQRYSSLKQVNIRSSGYGIVSHSYEYADPIVHGQGRFLVGYSVVGQESPYRTEKHQFHNDDDLSGIPVETVIRDGRTPDLERFSRRKYEERLYEGVRWFRPLQVLTGWRRPSSGNELTEILEYGSYEREICPTSSKTKNYHGELTREVALSNVPELAGTMHCLQAREVLTGIHSDSSLDFRYEQEVVRNEQGQVVQVVRHAPTGSLELQSVTYDSLHRIESVSTPGKGTTTVVYDVDTGLPVDVESPDGVVIRVSERHPNNDAITTLSTLRGQNSAFTEEFRYDDMERLHKTWRDFGGSSESQPLREYSYTFATLESPGAIFKRELVESQADAIRQTVTLVTASGDTVGKLERIPDGWKVNNLTRRSRENLSMSQYRRPPFLADIDPTHVTYDILISEAAFLSEEHVAAFGHLIDRRDLLPSESLEKLLQRTVNIGRRLDADSLVETTTVNNKYKTSTGRTVDDEVLWYQDQNGNVISLIYDVLGRLVLVRLPGGATHVQEYDAFGRTARIERTGVGSIAYEYNGTTGLLEEQRYFGNDGELARTIIYDYDSIGRLTSETYSLRTDAQQVYYYVYDGAHTTPPAPGQLGRLSHVRGEDYERVDNYNPDGSLESSKVRVADWREIYFSHTYNVDGSPAVTKNTISDAMHHEMLEVHKKSYRYDLVGRFEELQINDKPLVSLVYDPEGLVAVAPLHLFGSVVFSYDRVTRSLVGYSLLAPPVRSEVRWGFNSRGSIANEKLILGGIKHQRTYAYDVRGFLSDVSGDGNNVSYSYGIDGLPDNIADEKGARLLKREAKSLRAGDRHYVYDNLGRIVQVDDLLLEYGPNGQISSAQRGARRWRFVYDEAGARILKFDGDVPHSGFVAGGYLSESSFAEPLKVRGVIVGLVEKGRFIPIATDGRGTVLAERNGSPTLATPYGVRGKPTGISAVIDYMGSAYDPDLGFVRFGQRDFDPWISQWISPDPLYMGTPEAGVQSPLELSLYLFAKNNPLSFVDRSGTKPIDFRTELEGIARPPRFYGSQGIPSSFIRTRGATSPTIVGPGSAVSSILPTMPALPSEFSQIRAIGAGYTIGVFSQTVYKQGESLRNDYTASVPLLASAKYRMETDFSKPYVYYPSLGALVNQQYHYFALDQSILGIGKVGVGVRLSAHDPITLSNATFEMRAGLGPVQVRSGEGKESYFLELTPSVGPLRGFARVGLEREGTSLYDLATNPHPTMVESYSRGLVPRGGGGMLR